MAVDEGLGDEWADAASSRGATSGGGPRPGAVAGGLPLGALESEVARRFAGDPDGLALFRRVQLNALIELERQGEEAA